MKCGECKYFVFEESACDKDYSKNVGIDSKACELYTEEKEMRTLWVAYWKNGLPNHNAFETKEEAECYRDDFSINGAVEIFEVEEKKVADYEVAFGGYSNSDLEEEYKEFTTTEEPSLFQYPDEWAKAMREGRRFEYGEFEYFCDESFINPFRISSESYEISDAINASWEHYNKVTEIIEPKWYEDLGDGVWCKVRYEEEKSDIAKIIKVDMESVIPYEGRHSAWKHAEPVTEELAKLLDEES